MFAPNNVISRSLYIRVALCCRFNGIGRCDDAGRRTVMIHDPCGLIHHICSYLISAQSSAPLPSHTNFLSVFSVSTATVVPLSQLLRFCAMHMAPHGTVHTVHHADCWYVVVPGIQATDMHHNGQSVAKHAKQSTRNACTMHSRVPLLLSGMCRGPESWTLGYSRLRHHAYAVV